MKNEIYKKQHVAFLILGTLLLISPSLVFAAELSLGVGTPDASGMRDIAVILRTTAALNALEGKVTIPAGGIVEEVVDAGTPVQFWIVRPKVNDTKDAIVFSGIIPGGFAGEAALFHLRTKVDPKKLTIDKTATRLLINDGAGTPDTVKVNPPAPLPPQFALAPSSTDTTAPNPFVPQIATLPSAEGDRTLLVFNTHDDKSGVTRYEIAYAPTNVDPNDPALSWEKAESPTPLSSDKRMQYVYIKAIDGAGNARVAVVPPGSAQKSGLLPYRSLLFLSIIGTVIASLFCVMFFRKRKRAEHNAKFDNHS